MPEPPVSDGRQIKAILDASHRAWRKLTTDVVAVIDSSPDGLSVNGAQRILDLAPMQTPG
ncbi:hypothetical protein DEU38_10788 [Rhodococcus sp. AG1013]|uniref:hypothetical protein n=1 Tax=Rhodococcus sp. AG1013 TaxID=2183996 RepID=UPI000E2CC29B|nr:hypothetical protein [Rhodococcus sp. AG1013]RDI28116.1 hypothetical protein DEU38_10788 [Rhodococcus sp. AG1013]